VRRSSDLVNDDRSCRVDSLPQQSYKGQLTAKSRTHEYTVLSVLKTVTYLRYLSCLAVSCPSFSAPHTKLNKLPVVSYRHSARKRGGLILRRLWSPHVPGEFWSMTGPDPVVAGKLTQARCVRMDDRVVSCGRIFA